MSAALTYLVYVIVYGMGAAIILLLAWLVITIWNDASYTRSKIKRNNGAYQYWVERVAPKEHRQGSGDAIGVTDMH